MGTKWLRSRKFSRRANGCPASGRSIGAQFSAARGLTQSCFSTLATRLEREHQRATQPPQDKFSTQYARNLLKEVLRRPLESTSDHLWFGINHIGPRTGGAAGQRLRTNNATFHEDNPFSIGGFMGSILFASVLGTKSERRHPGISDFEFMRIVTRLTTVLSVVLICCALLAWTTSVTADRNAIGGEVVVDTVVGFHCGRVINVAVNGLGDGQSSSAPDWLIPRDMVWEASCYEKYEPLAVSAIVLSIAALLSLVLALAVRFRSRRNTTTNGPKPDMPEPVELDGAN